MRCIPGIVSLAMVTAIPAARAEDGFYMGGSVSYAVMSESDISDSAALAPGESATLQYNQGAAVSFDMGYRLGIGRVEAEIGYQRNGVSQYRPASGDVDATGGLTQTRALLNAYIDIPVGTSITPYIGAGVGVAQVNLDDFNIAGSGVPNSSSNDRVNVAQISIGGVSKINEHYDLDVSYRYLMSSDASFDDATLSLSGYLLSLGLRYNF
jgi:outer membrane autotransporter protein